VVHEEPTVDLKALDAEIAAVVADDYLVTEQLPLSGSVETLVDVPIEAERGVADGSWQRKVVEALFERLQSP